MEKLFRKEKIPEEILEYFEEVIPPTKPCVVADIFLGSGQTALVSYKHNRKFIGIELSKTYLDEIAIPRIKRERKQRKLF
jgi:adenine specific DNA methylase Mod